MRSVRVQKENFWSVSENQPFSKHVILGGLMSGGRLSSGLKSGGRLSGGRLSGGRLSGGRLSYDPVEWLLRLYCRPAGGLKFLKI